MARRPSSAATLGTIVESASLVNVSVSGSACSVAALLWVIQQGRLDAVVVFEPRSCHPKVTESYVRALAKTFRLRFETSYELAAGGLKRSKNLVVVFGARFGDPLKQTPDKAYTIVRPMVGKTEAEILKDLDRARVRPHPAITLGITDVCTESELREAAKRKTREAPSFEVALASAAVEAGQFPEDYVIFDENQKREPILPPKKKTQAEEAPEEDFEGEPVAEPAMTRPLGPDLGMDTLRANGYPAPKEWPVTGPAFREQGKVWLFSYGANSPKQLSERLGRAVKATPAAAIDRERTYVGHSTKWNGATATLVPLEGGLEPGGAVLVSEADLKKLDKAEGVPTKYQRQTIEIWLHPHNIASPKHRKVVAVAYLAAPGNQKLGAPTLPYLEAVLENLRQNGFLREGVFDMEPGVLDKKGKTRILYPNGVTPVKHHAGENTAEIWLRLSPAAKAAMLAHAQETHVGGAGATAKKLGLAYMSIHAWEKHLESVYGKKRWAAYKAEFAPFETR